MNIASHILYTLPRTIKNKIIYGHIISKKMCGNNNGIGGHQKIINIYPKTIYRKPRKQKNKK